MSAGVGEAADADVKRLKRKKEHGIKHYSKHTPRPYLNAGSFDLRVKLWGGEGYRCKNVVINCADFKTAPQNHLLRRKVMAGATDDLMCLL